MYVTIFCSNKIAKAFLATSFIQQYFCKSGIILLLCYIFLHMYIYTVIYLMMTPYNLPHCKYSIRASYLH